jgi:conjugative transfer signal peptidase TraF
LVALSAALASVVVIGSHRQDPLVVWNASPSSPRGLYLFAPGAPRIGDFVFARPPVAATALAVARGYLAPGVPLVKSVAAGPGEQVCANGKMLRIGRRTVAVRRAVDRKGRPLPQWSGCRVLGDSELLLLGTGDPDSFDSRYFGPVELDLILGRAALLWQV